MPLRPTANARVEIATAAAGPYALLGFVDDFRVAFDESDDDDHFFYGVADPFTIAGDEVYDVTVSGAYDPADVGQARAIAAKESQTPVYLRTFYTAKDYEQFAAKVRSYDYGGNRNDDKYLTTSYGIRGYGVITRAAIV